MKIDTIAPDETRETARNWVVRLASGNMGETEMRVFKDWLDQRTEHKQAFERERKVWQESAQLKALFRMADAPLGCVPEDISLPQRHRGKTLAVGTVFRNERRSRPEGHASGAACHADGASLNPAIEEYAQTNASEQSLGINSEIPNRHLIQRRWPGRFSQNRQRRYTAVAAIIAACFVLVGIWADIPTRLRADRMTAVGEVRNMQLPDGSSVILNTDSAIALHFTTNERRVDLLRGEAWFKVKNAQARPFRVYAQDVVTQDLSTAFAVRDIGDAVTVAVTEGRVVVQAPDDQGSADGRSIILNAGHQLSYRRDHSMTSEAVADASAALSWQQGRVVIEQRPLQDVIAEINRYRRGRIMLMDQSAGRSLVSGIFSIDKIDQGLEGLAASQHLKLTYVTPYLVVLR